MTTEPEITEWRAWGESWLAALIPALVAVVGLLTAYEGLTSGGSAGGVLFVVLGLGMAVLGAFLVVILYRTRTRLTSEGLEIRQTRPEVIPWTDIRSVGPDRSRGLRTILVTMHDGRTRTLPTPTQGKRPPSDTTINDAVAAMRRRMRR